MRIKIIILLSLAFVPNLVAAFFCPTNFTQINFGDTIGKVVQQCGKPNGHATKNVEREVPEEWSYFIVQTVATGSLTPTQGTLKVQITFDTDNKAINISVNGIGVGASNICGPSIQLGDSKQTIKKLCGTPAFVNSQKSNAPNAGTIAGGPTGAAPIVKSDKVTTFIYNSNPPIKLIFVNGKLIKKE